MTLRLRLRLTVLAAGAVVACGGAAHVFKHRAATGDVAIVGATVVPLDREGTLTGHTVLLRGDRIVAVAPAAEVDTTGATVIDGRGKWLLPGLADMHVHLWGEGDLAMFLLNGVTTVRNLFGSPEHVTWRDRIARGELDGPTLITAGPILDGDPPVWPGSDVVTTPEGAREAVRKQKAAGYDWLKVYNGLSVEVYEAILAEAKAQGMPVGGHVPRAVGIEKAIASGQRTIEHLDGYVPFFGDPHVSPEITAATGRAETWNCPTLIVTERFGRLDDPASLEGSPGLELVAPMVREAWKPENDFRLRRFTPEMFEAVRKKNEIRRQLVSDLVAAGAKLVLGTDTGNPFVIPGFAVHEEMTLLAGAGLTPWQILRSATVAPAQLLGTPGGFGVIVPGARADLILLDGDPLADLGAARSPSVIIARGKVHARDQLLAAIKQALAPVDDRFAQLPPIESEGTRVAAARYDVLFRDQTVGGERAVLSVAADKTRVVRGQAVYDAPRKAVFTYRATRDSLAMGGAGGAVDLKVTRTGGKVVLTSGTDVSESAFDPAAILAPQTIAEFFWYADALADLAVGASRKLDAAEIMTDGGVRIDPASFTFTRRADAGGRRVYDLTGKHGELDLTGTFSVDPDGAPHEVQVSVIFGTFITRRVEE